jgi:hypothetical protein
MVQTQMIVGMNFLYVATVIVDTKAWPRSIFP